MAIIQFEVCYRHKQVTFRSVISGNTGTKYRCQLQQNRMWHVHSENYFWRDFEIMNTAQLRAFIARRRKN